MLEKQLRGPEHVAGGVERDGCRSASHRLAIAEHPPAARPSRFRYEGQGLRCEQRLLVAARVVRMSMRNERKSADHQRIQPQSMAGNRDAAVPHNLGVHFPAVTSRKRSCSAKRPGGTSIPTAA